MPLYGTSILSSAFPYAFFTIRLCICHYCSISPQTPGFLGHDLDFRSRFIYLDSALVSYLFEAQEYCL